MTSNMRQSVSRRTALAGLGAGGLGLALAARGHHASAQDAAPASYAGHVQVGVWMIDSGIGRAIAVYGADGSVITALAPSQAGPQGVTFASTQIGTWEPTGDRTAHLTVVQLLSDAAGAYAGSVTVDAYQEVSDDGQSWASGEGTTVTIRDANHTVLAVNPAPAGAAQGVRMAPGLPRFPEGTPVAATPAA
jgi:hypothetical protein